MGLHDPAAIFVSIQQACMILPLWKEGNNTLEIAYKLAIPEYEVANRLPNLLEARRESSMAAVTTWTDHKVDKLKDLYGMGWSCSMIAADLGDGITRNAVIGKIHRLGLERRGGGSHAVVETGPRYTKARKPAAPSQMAPRKVVRSSVERENLRCVEIEPRHISLIDLEPGDCRYPFGDGPFTHCGHPKMDGASYCTPHFYLSIGPGTTSERAAAWGVNRLVDA